MHFQIHSEIDTKVFPIIDKLARHRPYVLGADKSVNAIQSLRPSHQRSIFVIDDLTHTVRVRLEVRFHSRIGNFKRVARLALSSSTLLTIKRVSF